MGFPPTKIGENDLFRNEREKEKKGETESDTISLPFSLGGAVNVQSLRSPVRRLRC